MSDLKHKLQQRLARSRSVHQELIQSREPEASEPEVESVSPKASPPPASRNSVGPGRPKKVKKKITTLYFDEDLDKALEMFLFQQYIASGTKTSKSEWIRNLVEESLRQNDAWPPK